jgi:hypothetical protein
MASRPSALPPSALLGMSIDLAELGEMQIVAPTVALAFEAKEKWAAGKRSRLVGWSWPKLVNEYAEALAIVDAQGAPRALLCSRRRRLLDLPRGPSFELGYVEVHPDDRGGLVGYYTFAVAAARALELGATGLVLGATPEAGLLRFYGRFKPLRGKIKGWQPPPGLTPFCFDKNVLTDLEGDLHAARTTKA